jgi:hypothetical protein
MNERLKELMLEAGYAAPELAGRANKLAELIVRECMDICYRTDTEYEGHKVKSTVIASKVAEHFGVD